MPGCSRRQRRDGANLVRVRAVWTVRSESNHLTDEFWQTRSLNWHGFLALKEEVEKERAANSLKAALN